MIKLTNLLKEIKVTPYHGRFQNIQQLADRINGDRFYKEELIDAVYNDAGLGQGWLNMKSDIVNGGIEIDRDVLIMPEDSDDAILISLESQPTIDDSIELNGITLYYGFI